MGFQKINPVGLQQEQSRDFIKGLQARFENIESRLEELEKSAEKKGADNGDSNKSSS